MSFAPEMLRNMCQSADAADRLRALRIMREELDSAPPKPYFFDLARPLTLDADNQCRWQAVIVIGEHIETEPSRLWDVVQELAHDADDDLRDALGTVLLEELLAHDFDEYFARVEAEIRAGNGALKDVLQRCWAFGDDAESKWWKVQRLLAEVTRRAVAYQSDDLLYFHSYSRTSSGSWIDSEPFIQLPPNAPLADIGLAVLRVLKESKPLVDDPADWAAWEAQIEEQSGIDDLVRFEQEARSRVLELVGDEISFNGNLLSICDPTVTVSATAPPEEIGARLRYAFNLNANVKRQTKVSETDPGRNEGLRNK